LRVGKKSQRGFEGPRKKPKRGKKIVGKLQKDHRDHRTWVKGPILENLSDSQKLGGGSKKRVTKCVQPRT